MGDVLDQMWTTCAMAASLEPRHAWQVPWKVLASRFAATSGDGSGIVEQVPLAQD